MRPVGGSALSPAARGTVLRRGTTPMGGTSKASPSLLGKVSSIPIGPHEYFVQEPDRLEVDFFVVVV